MTDTIILAAGGTGGHIFPAEALADELRTRGIRPILVTDKRFAGYGGAFAGVEVRTIAAGTLSKGIVGRVKGLLNTGRGLWQAGRLLSELKPIAVVGFGGYPSFPTMLAAVHKNIPTIIHEQNAVLGRANRVLAPRVNAIAATYPDTRHIDDEQKTKTILTGNPVRSAIRALGNIPFPSLAPDGAMRILILGGSQGASIFGQVLPAAIATLPPVLRSRIRIDQQCRPDDIETTRASYQQIGVNADLATFFTDVPARLAGAHLVITRAGASTVAELTTSGRPAILVPLPSAMDDHQTINAQALEETGGGWLMPQEGFTSAALAARIESFLTLPASLTKASEKARALGRPEAASSLADLVLAHARAEQKPSRQVAA